ncbi:MAG: entericidin A/B family lipoprotein [Betaproteobacteria bacterium]
MKRIGLFILALITFGLAACNTVQGVGKDIKKGGEAIERAANK